MPNLVAELAQKYTNFLVAGKQVKIPYCIVQQPGEALHSTQWARTALHQNYSAKGTPEEIAQALSETAAKQQFDLSSATSAQIREFMTFHGIGIDCSGFVYNVLERYVKLTKGLDLGQRIKLYPGLLGKLEQVIFPHKRVMRCSAMTLTSNLNTTEITKVADIQPGDMIRLTLPTWKGKHIAIITDITKTTLTYAHSGQLTEQSGPHLATIQIIDPQKGLEAQHWLEKLSDGTDYKTNSFHPEKGDSVRRLLA